MIVYYFLAIYLKGLLQSLKLYSGHPPDLVKCTADFDVSILPLLLCIISDKRILKNIFITFYSGLQNTFKINIVFPSDQQVNKCGNHFGGIYITMFTFICPHIDYNLIT